MKKFLILLLTLSCFALSSCGTVSSPNSSLENSASDFSNTESDTERHDVSLTEISSKGPISYESFLSQGLYYTDTYGDLIVPFYYNSKDGYADQEGNPVIENLNSGLYYNFSEGFAFSSHGDVIDQSGKVVFTLPDGAKGDHFKDGTAITLKKEHVEGSNYIYDYNVYIGLLDANMNFEENKIVLPEGMSIGQDLWYPINEDGYQGALGTFGSKTTNLQIGIVNASGKMVASFDAESAYKTAKAAFSFVNISQSITHSTAVGLADADLTKMIFFKNGYVNVMNENNQWGLLNLKTEQMAIDYAYDYVGAYSDGLIPVCKYGSWGAINIDGQEIIPCKSFQYISAFVNDRALAISEDGSICVIDKTGQVVSTVDVSVGKSTLGGFEESFFYTDFTETTHLACIYLHEKAYIISDAGEVLAYANTKSYRGMPEEFLYMNNDYLILCSNEVCVYKINYQNKLSIKELRLK